MTTLQTSPSTDRILRAHGGGGEMMGRLIQDEIVSVLGNDVLNALTDGAVLHVATPDIVFTTDSFVVQPLEFPGGSIGRLAVCGTVNDLAVMGGKPLGLSLGLILEEGLDLAVLRRVLRSLAEAAREAGVRVVTGDTKVIEHGSGSGIMINTAGVAELDRRIRVGFDHIAPGDAVLINGCVGDHGMAVVSVRNGLEFDTPIRSDAAPLWGLIRGLADDGVNIHFMRDPTRGGLAGVVTDICERTGFGVELYEERIPYERSVASAAEMLGLDVLTVANEGKVVVVVGPEDADRAVRCMRKHPHGRDASWIGTVVAGDWPLVELVTELGGRRIIQRPYGEELPRIC